MQRDPVDLEKEMTKIRARKRARFVIVVLILLAVSTLSAFANPTVNTTWGRYSVSSTTAPGLLAELKQKGPNGYWGFTTWHVYWTDRCEVTVNIDYVVPSHTNRTALTPSLRRRWDQMMGALVAHERKHGAHALNAARELVEKSCANGDAIVQKWSDQDALLDQRTGHGQTEGVTFP